MEKESISKGFSKSYSVEEEGEPNSSSSTVTYTTKSIPDGCSSSSTTTSCSEVGSNYTETKGVSYGESVCSNSTGVSSTTVATSKGSFSSSETSYTESD